MASKTIRFNVGGLIYEVSRSLLAQHPDTMLARMISKEWQPEEGPGKDDCALFIERDGERFRYCLDYMRNAGSVALPSTISKDEFLKDLTYYGFQDIDASEITTMGSAQAFQLSFDHLQSINTDWVKAIEKLGIKPKCLTLARHCLKYYLSTGELKWIPLDRHHNTHDEKTIDQLMSTANWLKKDDANYKDEFNSCLEEIGLKVKKVTNYKNKYFFTLEHIK